MSKFEHNDSYLVMTYECQGCEKRERIWNGRDAVSPFGVGCTVCEGIMNHVDWRDDVRMKLYVPPKGTRYFTDFTPERAEFAAKRRITQFDGTEYELKEGTPDYLEMVEELKKDFLTSMDLVTA